MKIDHIGIWVINLENIIEFYKKYFGAIPGKFYNNPVKNFTSCFLEFPSGARIELMHNPSIPAKPGRVGDQHTGLIHFAIAAGSEEEVDRISRQLKAEGIAILDGPRRTGDGYYETVILDPEGNRVEITI